jgi:hypothetical protein
MSRRFYLVRCNDLSGVSGCGVVAEGIEWSDGSATMHWLGEHASHDSQANSLNSKSEMVSGIDVMRLRHEHSGNGFIVYADQIPLKDTLLKVKIAGKEFTLYGNKLHVLQAYDLSRERPRKRSAA